MSPKRSEREQLLRLRVMAGSMHLDSIDIGGRGDGHRPRGLPLADTALTQDTGVAPAVNGATQHGNHTGRPE